MKRLSVFVGAGLLSVALHAGTWLTGTPVKMQTWMNDTVFFLKDANDNNCLYKFLPASGTSVEQQKLFKAMYLSALMGGKTVEINVDRVECIPDEGVAPANAFAIKVLSN